MPKCVVSRQRSDPYKHFKIRVKWADRYVAGFNEVSGLTGTMGVLEYRKDGDSNAYRKLPGPLGCEAITLERGVSHDIRFAQWANSGLVVALNDSRKDLTIVLCNEVSQPALALRVFRCWVSEFQSSRGMDPNTSGMAINYLRLENEGWEQLLFNDGL